MGMLDFLKKPKMQELPAGTTGLPKCQAAYH